MAIGFIDTHAHIGCTSIALQAEVLAAMRAEKIAAVDVGIDVKTSEKVIQFAQRNTFTCPVIGVHPYYASEGLRSFPDFKSLLERNLKEIKAIGEIGLDMKSSELLPTQEKMLTEYLRLASEYRLPVVIHSRGYFDELIRILMAFPELKILFHCFSYGITELNALLEKGYFISFALNIFKNNALDECIKSVPPERLLLETDCPYMYFDKKESTPLHIKDMAQRVSALRGVEQQCLLERMRQTAREFFNLTGEEWQ